MCPGGVGVGRRKLRRVDSCVETAKEGPAEGIGSGLPGFFEG